MTSAAMESLARAREALLARGGAFSEESRAAAWRQFVAEGFPPARNEAWKYTPPTRLFDRSFHLAEPAGIEGLSLPEPLPGASRRVFVNGRLVAHQSGTGDPVSPVQPHVQPERSAQREVEGSVGPSDREKPSHSVLHGDARTADPSTPALRAYAQGERGGERLAALNQALFEDATVLDLPANADGGLVELVHVMRQAPDGAMAHPRVVLRLGAGAKLKVVERYLGDADGAYFVNALTDVELGEGAQLEHVVLQTEGARALHVGTFRVFQSAKSRCVSHLVQLGGGTSRRELRIRLAGDGAEVSLDGLFVTGRGQHHDQDVAIEHEACGCTSRQRFRGILSETARGVFTGRVRVHRDAQRTDADQSARVLLLSTDAEADLRPHLEIDADDVKATHGATVGELDADQIFYLRSRGIPEPEARALLTEAFAREVLEALGVPELKAQAEAGLHRALHSGKEA